MSDPNHKPWTAEEKNKVEQMMMFHIRSRIPITRAVMLVAADLDRTYDAIYRVWYRQLMKKHKKEIDEIYKRNEPKQQKPVEEVQPIYIALDDLDFNFEWDPKEVEQFDAWYKEGVSIQEMAERFNRQPDEVLVLLIDRANKNKLSKRKKSIPMYKQRMMQSV